MSFDPENVERRQNCFMSNPIAVNGGNYPATVSYGEAGVRASDYDALLALYRERLLELNSGMGQETR